MLRSVGIAAVVMGLAWTGLAGAQSSSPLEKARYINVSEEGKPTQRCKLLRSWREPNGVPAFLVQAVGSGEMMTIVATAPKGAGGDPREMTTRIFRWGQDNKPPAGAPVPPPTATVLTTRPQPVVERKPPTPPPQAIRPAPVAVSPRPTQTAVTVQKPAPAPAPVPSKPAIGQYTLTSNKSDSSPVAAKPKPVVPSKPQTLTPMSTQVVQYSAASTQPKQLPDVPSTTNPQPRLAPLAAGSAASPKPCNCPCPPPCQPCCKPCDPCCQSSCVCSTTSPMRQPLIGRLFKSNTPCPCTTVASQPPSVPTQSVGTSAVKPAAVTPPKPVLVKTTTEPAKSNDWRQSWGKVEPWKGSAQANTSVKPVEVAKRADPTPVRMDPPKQPDPLKAPDHYRDLVMNARLANSKIPQEAQAAVVVEPKKGLLRGLTVAKPPAPRFEEPLPPDRTIVISPDEPNAFWSPKTPEPKQKPIFNAFDRQPDPPPQDAPPTSVGIVPNAHSIPPVIPGIMQGPPPQGVVLKNPPCPPTAPYMPPPGPPRPMAPDTGVANGMGNAFTLAATHRPIPADFGGTPQEPNGFDPPIQPGQGTPPLAYGMGMSGTYRPQMPNMAAMAPQVPMVVNPLMNVPPSGRPVAFAGASTPPGSVPQMLTTLKDSLRPSEREAAAEQLSQLNWRVQPVVVDGLMRAAHEDPAATVRAACVHALAHMRVNTPTALALVRELKSDGDPNVRQEAEEALNTLGDSGIQQASHK
jgi:hypothetical protein